MLLHMMNLQMKNIIQLLNNGNEFTWINQNEYDNAKKSIQYKKVVENYSDMYYFYNNNKVN